MGTETAQIDESLKATTTTTTTTTTI